MHEIPQADEREELFAGMQEPVGHFVAELESGDPATREAFDHYRLHLEGGAIRAHGLASIARDRRIDPTEEPVWGSDETSYSFRLREEIRGFMLEIIECLETNDALEPTVRPGLDYWKMFDETASPEESTTWRDALVCTAEGHLQEAYKRGFENVQSSEVNHFMFDSFRRADPKTRELAKNYLSLKLALLNMTLQRYFGRQPKNDIVRFPRTEYARKGQVYAALQERLGITKEVAEANLVNEIAEEIVDPLEQALAEREWQQDHGKPIAEKNTEKRPRTYTQRMSIQELMGGTRSDIMYEPSKDVYRPDRVHDLDNLKDYRLDMSKLSRN
ncbi:MAG: hypothetical protein KJ709_00080 [Nanoarchaeota archaeon]|nr:hypothetical protein [Nanoarchaeota archaeon]